MKKLLIFILTYNAGKTIASVLDRIPDNVLDSEHYHTDILILDDASTDNTVATARKYISKHNLPATLLFNSVNQGYGGNQKVGYTYAIKHGFDAVVMLHGDGQYPPEMIHEMAMPIVEEKAEAVFGSRMLTKGGAREGGMPLYKYIGNKTLTHFQNFVTSKKLSEFHTGFRAYAVKTLNAIPLQFNSDDFDFDTDIILQLFNKKAIIKEIPIPTHYGDEICHVNGIKYAYQVVKATLLSRVQKFGIYYNPKFDLDKEEETYKSKVAFDSSHSFAIDQIEAGSVVLDFGCGSGHVAKALQAKDCRVYGIDQYTSKTTHQYFTKFYEDDFNAPDFTLPDVAEPIDYIVLLDVIEHLVNPELFLEKLRDKFSDQEPTVIITTANVAFSLVRLSLLVGAFNYGKRGILDLTHKRLYTFASLRRTLQQHGYAMSKMMGIPIPAPFVFGSTFWSKLFLRINNICIWLHKGFFSYQIAVVTKMRPTLNVLLKSAERSKKSL